ncbi:hypothetical protein [Altererythrobacter sp. Root672]|uniref:glucuronyl esterase domain-containing protein n=1 Tax=Altererythrobacter sp. Root672 TaxID=1736584 RepID=UPI0006F9417C|nr:hypothetical protein [Altererythrobacter sp. Root672]KRA83160.1 hypothetical protein ASD76_03560 [Altererythrobacter sp. Root672]
MALLALVSGTAASAQTAEDVHASERSRFGFGELRRGASGTPTDANAANSEEAKVGQFALPPLFAGSTPPTPEQWGQRRAELVRLVEDNWVGRIPEVVSQFKIVWRKEQVEGRRGATAEQWIGQVIAPDGRMGPTIDAILTFPAKAANTPALIDYTYIWPGGRTPNFGGPPPPDGVAMALSRGFTHVAFRPQMLQADSAAQMQQGVIGLARWPREKTDWGALRAWAWGASQLREEMARDPRINGERISLQGHSRFGKGVLVAAAFDHAFADANVSSSGAGGAKLMRRDFGERWENMASSGAFHWFTPNIMDYARGDRTTANLPIDAHTLIALRAPRPLFITSGVAEKGDAWVDPTGMWQAERAAQPAWLVFGSTVPTAAMPKPGTDDDAKYKLGWYQHTEGHIPWPGYEEFFEHEARFAAP